MAHDSQSNPDQHDFEYEEEQPEEMMEEEQPEEIMEEEPICEYTPPKLENQSGTICWLNSIIQLLLLTVDGQTDGSLLKICFRNLQQSHHIKSNESLRRLVAEKKPELRHGQQDSFDIFSALADFSASDKE